MQPADGWCLVRDARYRIGAKIYDEHVRSLFTLYPRQQYKDVNDVWICFQKKFTNLKPILSYMPVRIAYFKQALKEFHEDGVQYVEIRAGLKKVITNVNCVLVTVQHCQSTDSQ